MALFGIEMKRPHWPKWNTVSFDRDFLFFFFFLTVTFYCCPFRLLYCVECNVDGHILHFFPLAFWPFPILLQKNPPAAVIVARTHFCWSIQLLNGYSEHSHQIHGTMSVRLWVDQQTLVSYTSVVFCVHLN